MSEATTRDRLRGCLLGLAAGDAAEAIAMAADSSRTTHQAQEAVDACRYFAGLLVGALRGVDKETLLSEGYCPVDGLWERDPLAEKIARVAGGSFKDRNPPDIRGTGYIVDALEGPCGPSTAPMTSARAPCLP